MYKSTKIKDQERPTISYPITNFDTEDASIWKLIREIDAVLGETLINKPDLREEITRIKAKKNIKEIPNDSSTQLQKPSCLIKIKMRKGNLQIAK